MSRARILGQYFTPEPVVDLCYRMLRAFDPQASNPRIIDPACGEGAFLTYALEHGITPLDHLYGIEKDAEVAASVKDLSQDNLLIGDGLTPETPNLPEGGFDWVVGNPPFGTRGLTGSESAFTIWHGRRSPRYPIEILFLERFWQLAKPGGYVAIIIPDGILANARLSYVREWLSQRAAIKAIISLPQHTFHRTGASAKASVLVFRKSSPANEPVLMKALEPDMWEVPLPGDGARWDPAYYHPKYAENLRLLGSLPNIVPFGELIGYTTYGQVGAREYARSGMRLLTPANLVPSDDGYVTGIDIRSHERFVPPSSRSDPARSRLRKGDLLLVNSGVGCIGRTAVFYSDEPCNISQHINLIRVRGIEPEYLAVYLQTEFARLQIGCEKCGVGPCGINFSRIRSLLVPILAENLRRGIVQGYLRLSARPADADVLIRELVAGLERLILPRRR